MADVQQLKVIATADVGNLTTGMKDVQASLAKTAIVAAKMDSQLGKMSGGANQANNAMLNLGRVVQDAPYGIIGVTNNINPLVESFQRLKTETGSVKGAFQALAGSLMGGAGLGLAISLITSLMTTMAMQTSQADESLKKMSETLSKVGVSFFNVNAAFDAYNQGIISSSDALEIYNKELGDSLGKTNDIAVAERRLIEYGGAFIKVTLLKAQSQALFAQAAEKGAKALLLQDQLSKKTKQAATLGIDLSSLQTDIDKLLVDFGDLYKLGQQLAIEALKIKLPKTELPDKITGTGQKIEVEGVLMKFKRSDIQLDIDELKEISSKIEGKIRDGGGLNLKFKTNVFFEVDFAKVTAQVDGLKTMLSNLIDGLGNNLSEAFTSAIKGGNFFGSLFGSILKSLGAGVTQLGIQVIAASELIMTAKAALKAGGISGIGAGIALVALGAIISAAANSIKGASFATGVRNFSGGIATVGERGPERVFLPAGSSVQPNNEMRAYSGGGGSERLVAVVSGQDLAFILTRAQKTMNSSYGI